jgi:anthraniloyl-CoA monooxygenase
MKIAIAGGGPGGLYLAALMKGLDPRHEVTVWERNAPDETFGFGVVFSDETLGGIEGADPVVHDQMERRFARWTDIDIEVSYLPGGRPPVPPDVRTAGPDRKNRDLIRPARTDEGLQKGRPCEVHRFTVGGQGFAAMSRKDLLRVLQGRAADLGVDVRYRTQAPDVARLRATHDLVVAADGVNSAIRTRDAAAFGPDIDQRVNKYIWLGTDLVFEAFQFFVKQTPWGTMQIHGYPYSGAGSTFIVEMHEQVWRAAGFDKTERDGLSPGASDEYAVGRIREIFADELRGHQILTNNSKWLNFRTVRNARWHDGNVVLLGDAAHTAHFSIGSGTKLAMEDALALAACLHEHPSVEAALDAYQAERKPVVESTQRAAQASLEWFENIGMYAGQDPAQFAFNLLTRSRRITFANLRERDEEFAGRVEAEFARRAGAEAIFRGGTVHPGDTPDPAGHPGDSPDPAGHPGDSPDPAGHPGDTPDPAGPCPPSIPAMFTPARIGPLELKNRVIVSSMDMYSAEEGVPGEFHLVHLGSKALGGAGLVMTEMTCVSPEGRITLGCPGLWTDEQRDRWAAITRFVHQRSTAKIGLQLGHSGRKGSTRLMWEGMDEPLPDGNWEVIGPSALPYGAGCHVPREATRADMDKLVADFAAAARRGVQAGFDLIEVHAAHGYLLSSFLSPVSNTRTDRYGGPLENRLRFPLEVFDAVRAAAAGAVPVTVRISAADWVPGGITADDAVEIARAFIAHGAAAIDVSSGQVSKDERPAFGRSYQTPFADKIRHQVAGPAGVAVIAVGAISSYDDVNSILLAGRADLCALGRTHLFDPQWTLHAAAEQGYAGDGARWPVQWQAGSRKPPSSRTDKIAPRLSLLRAAPTVAAHLRWTPAPESVTA